MFGKENKKKELIGSLGDIYKRIEREHQISPGDFPNLKKMQVKEWRWNEFTCTAEVVNYCCSEPEVSKVL